MWKGLVVMRTDSVRARGAVFVLAEIRLLDLPTCLTKFW